MATNAEVAERLGVSHSTVSRMRTGTRVGSPKVLQKIHETYSIPLNEVMDAAVKARDGHPAAWRKVMQKVMGS